MTFEGDLTTGGRWQWGVGLEYFLRHSTEDAAHVEFLSGLIRLLIDTRWENSDQRFDIADLGCGNAAKSLGAAGAVLALGYDVRLSLVDVGPWWRALVEKNVTELLGTRSADVVRISIPRSADEWLEEQVSTPNLIVLSHVAYCQKTEALVRRICSMSVPRGAFVLIATESERSDLAVLRRQLASEYDRELPGARLPALKHWLSEQPWQTWSFTLQGQHLQVPQQIGTRWFRDIVFGESEISGVDSAGRRAIERRIHALATGLTLDGMLAIPDDVVVVWRGGMLGAG